MSVVGPLLRVREIKIGNDVKLEIFNKHDQVIALDPLKMPDNRKLLPSICRYLFPFILLGGRRQVKLSIVPKDAMHGQQLDLNPAHDVSFHNPNHPGA